MIEAVEVIGLMMEIGKQLKDIRHLNQYNWIALTYTKQTLQWILEDLNELTGLMLAESIKNSKPTNSR